MDVIFYKIKEKLYKKIIEDAYYSIRRKYSYLPDHYVYKDINKKLDNKKYYIIGIIIESKVLTFRIIIDKILYSFKINRYAGK